MTATYRSSARYRSGRIYRWGDRSDSGSATDAGTLTVHIQPSETVNVSEQVVGGIVLTTLLDLITGTDGHGVSFVLSDTASTGESHLAGTGFTGSDTATAFSDAVNYRSANDYRTNLWYRQPGQHVDIAHAVQFEDGSGTETESFTVSVTLSDVLTALEAAGLEVSSSDSVTSVTEAGGVELVLAETINVSDTDAGGDRQTVDGEAVSLALNLLGPYGSGMQKLSVLAVDRYRKMRVRRR